MTKLTPTHILKKGVTVGVIVGSEYYDVQALTNNCDMIVQIIKDGANASCVMSITGTIYLVKTSDLTEIPKTPQAEEFKFGQRGWLCNTSPSESFEGVFIGYGIDVVRGIVKGKELVECFTFFSIEKPTTKPQIEGFELVEIDQIDMTFRSLLDNTHTDLSSAIDNADFAGFVYEEQPQDIFNRSILYKEGGRSAHDMYKKGRKVIRPTHVAFTK